MRSILALRDFALVVVASCLTVLAPSAFSRDTPRFDPIPCPDLPPQLANARCGRSQADAAEVLIGAGIGHDGAGRARASV